MVVSPTLSCSAFKLGCALNSASARPSLGGYGRQSGPCKVARVVCSDTVSSKKEWSRVKPGVANSGARKGRSLVAAAAAEGVAVDVNAPASVLVEQLLSLVEGTDRGTQIGEPEKCAINEIVAKLETQCIPEPLSSPLLFGDWEVAYSSNPTAPGGYYRSMLGRALLKTRDMVQSINAPDLISNKVAFAAFGLVEGKVTLQGKLTVLDQKWVEVVFEPPQVMLGSFKTQYGGNSNVKLAILYLDEVVRIGRGSRGSLFIFKRRT